MGVNLRLTRVLVLFVAAAGTAVVARAITGPGSESHGPSQSIADALRQFANSDTAFVPAGIIKEPGSNSNLASYLMYPADGVSLVTLKGSQIRQALERSLALYPSSNSGFLQLSGIEASFKKGAPVGSRLASVSVGGQKLEDGKSYSVAMPTTLANGGFGYFRVWDQSAVTKEFSGASLESVLEGKPLRETSPRWTAVSG